MEIRICKHCGCPVSECRCTEEEKNKWLNQRREQLMKEKERLERNIENYERRMQQPPVERIQREPEKICYEQNSFHVDDDILDVMMILWKKGYMAYNSCAGHPEDGLYTFFIMFCQDYYFDFTAFPFEPGWQYARYEGHVLRFYFTQKLLKRLEVYGIDYREYFLHQRELLLKWAEQLPEARLADRDKRLPGFEPGKSRIPVQNDLVSWQKRKE